MDVGNSDTHGISGEICFSGFGQRRVKLTVGAEWTMKTIDLNE